MRSSVAAFEGRPHPTSPAVHVWLAATEPDAIWEAALRRLDEGSRLPDVVWVLSLAAARLADPERRAQLAPFL